MAFKLGMTVDLCMTYMLVLILMTLTLDNARSQWPGRGKHSVLNYLDNEASIKHARLSYVSHDLDFDMA